MSTPVPIPQLERPAFFDGQLLVAEDLGAIYDFHRQVRWLHNRTLHNWGIAFGLSAAGKKGDVSVSVTPGYALDCVGHDIVLSQAQTVGVPPIAGAAAGGAALLYLTVSWASDDQLPVSESRGGSCGSEGAVRRDEAPLLRWQDPSDVTSPDARFRRGYDLVLATAYVQNCKLAAPLSPAQRREAAPATQPFVAAGRTASGKTIWKFFPDTGTPLGVATVVDTSAAGFQTTPAYSAQVSGSLTTPGGVVLDGFPVIDSPTPVQFTLRVLMPRNLAAGGSAMNPDSIFKPTLLDTLRTDMAWHVDWLGVEG